MEEHVSALTKAADGDRVTISADDYVLVIDRTGNRYYLRHHERGLTALMLGLALLFFVVGVIEAVAAGLTGDSTDILGAVLGLGAGTVYLVWWAVDRFRPASVFLDGEILVSRGRFGRRRRAAAADIDHIGIGVRHVFFPTMYTIGLEAVTPYVQLQTARRFWLYGLSAATTRSPGPSPRPQQEAVHRIRARLGVKSAGDAVRYVGRGSSRRPRS